MWSSIFQDFTSRAYEFARKTAATVALLLMQALLTKSFRQRLRNRRQRRHDSHES